MDTGESETYRAGKQAGDPEKKEPVLQFKPEGYLLAEFPLFKGSLVFF